MKLKHYLAIAVIVLCIVGLSLVSGSTTDIKAEPTPAPVSDEYENGVEQVMSREEFKRQQALLAKEIYLKEEKTRIQKEYDEKLKKIEIDLEEVRKLKVTF